MPFTAAEQTLANIHGFMREPLAKFNEEVRSDKCVFPAQPNHQLPNINYHLLFTFNFYRRRLRWPKQRVMPGTNTAGTKTQEKIRQQSRKDTTRLTFWGVRGSIPTPGPTTLRYGGNTSCIEV